MPTKQKNTQLELDLIAKYNKLLAAAKGLKAQNTDLLAQNTALKVDLDAAKGSQSSLDVEDLIAAYEDKITRVIRMVKDPDIDMHSLSRRVANTLRPVV